MANQRPPSRSQPRRSGGRSAAGRSWARKRGAAARPSPRRAAPGGPRACPAPLALGVPACAMGRGPAPPDSDTRGSSARTVKRLLCAPGAGQGAGARWTLGRALAGWVRCPRASSPSPRVQRCRGPCVHLLCAGWCGAPGEEGAEPDPQDLPPPRGEDTTLVTRTLSVAVRFVAY
ncbi:hypothetical protein VULLAG_LOCUS22313 [Vulpes lagopus]